MKNNKIRRIILSGNTAWGMYNFRSSLLSHLVSLGYEVYVAAPYDNIYFDKLEKLGCTVFNLPINAKGTNPLEDIKLIARYYRIFRKIHPDISLTYTIKPNIYGSIAAQITKTHHMPITTGLGYVFLNSGITSFVAKALYKIAFAKADSVLFLNNDDMEIFKSLHLLASNKAVRLYGEGVDIDKFYFTPKENFSKDNVTFLLIGRMLYDKGIREYVEAAKLIKKRYKKVTFKLLGAIWEGNPSSITHQQIETWEKLGYVDYLGETSDVRPFIEDADCVVLPSYREGIPCTLMEASSMGRPLIATDVPGCNEVLEDNYNGFICNVKSSISLANQMEHFLKLSFDEKLRLGRNGRLLMEKKFCIERIISQYDKLLNNGILYISFGLAVTMLL